jgi:hypothetical protein
MCAIRKVEGGGGATIIAYGEQVNQKLPHPTFVGSLLIAEAE